ncbi:MAG: GGDEF domain-containing protein [Clostridia bacterium]|nr:GGDEF domain-containing protein [Clostridia bacterium]
MKIKELFGVDPKLENTALESISEADNEIMTTNIKRAVAIALLMIVFEFLLIVFYDMRQLLFRQNHSIAEYSYLILHLLIMMTCIINILLLVRIRKSHMPRTEKMKKYESILFLTPTLIMICLAFICALDQQKTGSISVYTVNTIIVCALIYQKPPRNIISFFIPFVVFVAGLIVFQSDEQLMMTNIINGSIFFISVIIISTFFYYNFFNSTLRGVLLKEANIKLEESSNVDSLTGLYNRRYLNLIMKRELNYMKRYQETCVILLIDIDDFKAVNDTYGHPAGDKVLVELSSILKQAIRESDLPIRWGGEEFMLMLFKCEARKITPMVERLLEYIRKYQFTIDHHRKISLSVSIGISQLSGYADDDFNKAYEKADHALYKAKRTGKDRMIVTG